MISDFSKRIENLSGLRAEELIIILSKNRFEKKIENALINKEKELAKSYLELAELTSNLENIIYIISETDNTKSDFEFLNLLLDKAFNLIPEADYGRIYINDQDGGYFLKSVYREKKLYLDEIETESDYFQKRSQDIIFTKEEKLKKLIIKLEINKNLSGAVILYIFEDNPGEFSFSSKRLASSLEKLASSFLSKKRYNKLQKEFTEEIIISLTKLLEIHDNYTMGHNQKVAEMSKRLAEVLDLKEKEIQKSYWTGILHDIGKTVIPARILNKRNKLTKEEYKIIKKHPEWAYKTLSNSRELREIAVFVLHHHERWDGSGYPDQLKNEEIPLISRIVALADSWDAMLSDRSYRKAMSKEKAVKEIIKNKGKQFDPLITEVFLDKIIKIS